MPRNPKNIPGYQGFGRPHTALVNPEKYGLTYEEAVALVDSGEWRTFYKNWLRDGKHDHRIIYCDNCHSPTVKTFMTVIGKNLCEDCVNAIRRRAYEKAIKTI